MYWSLLALTALSYWTYLADKERNRKLAQMWLDGADDAGFLAGMLAEHYKEDYPGVRVLRARRRHCLYQAWLLLGEDMM